MAQIQPVGTAEPPKNLELDRSAPETARVARLLLDRVQSELPTAGAWVHVVGDHPNELRLVATRGLPDDTARAKAVLGKTAPFVESAAARTLQPSVLRADRAQPGLEGSQATLALTRSAALLSLPLVVGEQLVGVVTCLSKEPVPPAHIETLSLLVEPFAIGLGAARSLDRERVRHAQLDRLRRAALAIAEATTLKVALQTIVDEARALVNARYAALGIVADADMHAPFNPWVQSGMSPAQAAAIGRTPRPVGLLGAVPREGRAIRLKNLALDPRYTGVPANHPEVSSFLGVPVAGRERAVGNLYLADKIDAEEFSEDDEHAISLLAQHAGVAVERFGDIERAEREAQYGARARRALAAQLSTAQVLAQAPPVEVAAKRVLQAIGDALGWEWGCLWLLDPTANVLHAAATWRRESLSAPEFEALSNRISFPPGVGMPGRVWSSGKPAWVHDVVDDPRFLRLALAAREGLHGALFVPVTTDGAFLGVMEIMSREVRPPDDELLAMLAASGAQIGQLIARRRAEDEREKLLASLSAERSWLRAVVERSPVGIVLALGRDGNRIVANRRASELLGIDFAPERGLAQLSGRLTGIDGRPLPDADIPIRRALETGELVSGDELLWRSAVGERALLVNASPIDDAEGHRIGAAMVIEDISSLRELQKLRDEWTSMVAHDLRQPVNTIALSAQLIARGGAQPDVQELAKQILSGSRRLDRMIEDLLDASQIDARRLKLVKEETDVTALLTAVIARAKAVTAGHVVTVDVRGAVPKLMIDPARIEQVLFNLLANAGKYGSENGKIEVTAERRDGEVQISVLNEGPPIAREDLEGFFARFRRGTTRSPGSGLGLYISRGLIEAHGGRIWAEGVRPGWTAFRLALPIAS
jgi:signal transduction histidine kinase/transcriptional regulator with GAF, ATPase, and Fis domain